MLGTQPTLTHVPPSGSGPLTIAVLAPSSLALIAAAKYELVMQQASNVTFVEGTAEFLDQQRLRLGAEVIRAERIPIATGSTAVPPPVPGLIEAGFLTHITALASEHLPKSLLVLGGGPLGLEFAQIDARFGTQVTLAIKGPQLFARTEPELSHQLELEQVFVDKGITVLKEAEAVSLKRRGNLKVDCWRPCPRGKRRGRVNPKDSNDRRAGARDVTCLPDPLREPETQRSFAGD